jgi:hypothetical protein
MASLDKGAGAVSSDTLRVIEASDSEIVARLGATTTPATGTVNKQLETIAARVGTTSDAGTLAKLLSDILAKIVASAALDATVSVTNTRLGDTTGPATGTVNKQLADILAKIIASPATEATVGNVSTRLGDTSAPASGTTNKLLTDILAKIISAPATEATLANIYARMTAALATETTLANIYARMTAALATEATLAAIQTQINLQTGSGRTFSTVAITQDASGWITLKQQSGKIPALHAIVLGSDTVGTTVQIEYNGTAAHSGATALSGVMPMGQYGGFTIPFNADARGCLKVNATSEYLGINTTTGKVFGFAVVSTD